jgi:hypothetical protein
MARATYEVLKVKFLTTLASATLAPTVAEYTAGVDLTGVLPVTGVQPSGTQNNASLAMLGQAHIDTQPGTWSGGPITLQAVRDTVSDLLVTTFPYGTAGFLIINWTGVTVVAGVKVDSYAVKSHQPIPMNSEENGFQQWTVQLPVTTTPKYNIAVLA